MTEPAGTPSRDPSPTSSVATLCGFATWPLLVVTFIYLLGGFHPSDRKRDAVVLAAGIAILLLNAPMAREIALGFRRGARARDPWVRLVFLVARLAAAAWVLWFAGSISHEGRG
jgi:hypothetical protein